MKKLNQLFIVLAFLPFISSAQTQSTDAPPDANITTPASRRAALPGSGIYSINTYCTSGGTSTAYEWIQCFAIANLNNSSGNNGGYHDYTSLPLQMIQGTAYSFTCIPGFSGTSKPE